MAFVDFFIDVSHSGSSLKVVAARYGVQLATIAATKAQLASGAWVATASLDLSLAGVGPVTIALLNSTNQLIDKYDGYIDENDEFLSVSELCTEILKIPRAAEFLTPGTEVHHEMTNFVDKDNVYIRLRGT